MKQPYYFCLLTILLLLSSCNKDEGKGGSSSVEGYVYNVVHKDDNFSFTKDTIPAVGEKVYIVYGGDEDGPIADKDVDANKNGMYRFEYLRKGNYVVYALSSYPDELYKEKKAEFKYVKIGSGTTKAENIYIHSGKAYGLSMIKGTVFVQWYDKGVPKKELIPAVEHRVYLKHFGEQTAFKDERVGDKGYFYFQKVPPGKYEVYTTTEEADLKNRLLPTSPQIIEVVEAETVYTLPEEFKIIMNM